VLLGWFAAALENADASALADTDFNFDFGASYTAEQVRSWGLDEGGLRRWTRCPASGPADGIPMPLAAWSGDLRPGDARAWRSTLEESKGSDQR
jgi:hypothetical protein